MRLLEDMQLERLQLPRQLLERFVEVEFQRLDTDDSEVALISHPSPLTFYTLYTLHTRHPSLFTLHPSPFTLHPWLSQGIELAEFVSYIANLSQWLRTELQADFHQRNVRK